MIRAPRPSAIPCCLLRAAMLILIAYLHLGAAASVAGPATNTNGTSPVFNAATDADNHAFVRNAQRPVQVRADGRGEFADQERLIGNASAVASSNSTGALVRRRRTHHHHHHIHAGHYNQGGASLPQSFDNALYKAVGLLDSNTCVSKFVCEVVARRGAQSFIGTTIGSIFKGLAHAPPSSAAHALWRAAAIGKHGWLPVCSSAYPQCSSSISTIFSVLNIIG
ncbi:hypothetical protein HPB49_018967 [Dermacentor silvarum]|uniref:Uncharacterized protein n=1 Tax=Dermacentor silvarum TaxID=543639 RepID=A0ACB8D7D8_DERSI|nr:hypothetical protein HPB49_018967 [Dermacentor silvarum]